MLVTELATQEKPNSARTRLKGIQVLYVGTNASTMLLQDCMPELTVLRDGQQALEQLCNGELTPDVVLVEQKQEGMRSFDFCTAANELSMKPRPAFLLLAATNLSEATKAYALASGFDDIVDRHTSQEALVTRLQYLLLQGKSVHQAQPGKRKSVGMPLAKRTFDVLAAGGALLLLSPVLLLVALLIKLDSPGPVFYVSKRVGSGYKVFNFLKFRTMKVGADKELKNLDHLNQYAEGERYQPHDLHQCCDCAALGHACSPLLVVDDREICEAQHLRMKSEGSSSFVKLANDPRVTRLGRFLRNTSIDELPQLWNIFRGDMSVVGNRPLPLYEAEQLTTDEWSQRFLAPAGLTGLWQVKKRGKADMSEEERKQLDNEYARTYSFWSDMKLILGTIPALLQKADV